MSTHHEPRDIAFHLTLTDADRELLDTLAARMDCSRTEVVARALHLLDSVQTREMGHHETHTAPRDLQSRDRQKIVYAAARPRSAKRASISFRKDS